MREDEVSSFFVRSDNVNIRGFVDLAVSGVFSCFIWAWPK